MILIGSGSEVHDLLAARETLAADGIGVRVVSLPDWNLFMAQPQGYRDEVLPPASGGASRSRPARRSAGRRSSATAARRSGSIATAPRPRRPTIAEHLGITPEAVVAAARALL